MAKKASFFRLNGTAFLGVIAILIALLVISLYSFGYFPGNEPSSTQVPESESQDVRQSDQVETADVASKQSDNVSAAEPVSKAGAASSAPTPPLESEILNPPTLDILRVAPDGTTVLAGKGDAKSAIKVLIDGVEVAAATVGSNGEFALVLDLPPSQNPRVMSLTAQQGSQLVYGEDFIIAPTMTAVVESNDVTSPTPNSPSSPELDALTPPVPVEEQKPDEILVARLDTSEDEASLAADQNLVDNQLLDDGSDESDETTEKSLSTGLPIESNDSQALALPNAVTVLRSAPTGVERFTTDQSEAMDQDTQILLDTISYDDSGNVLLSGRGAPNTLTNLYLDNKKRLQFSIDADGQWNAQLESIEPNVYLLRLDALRQDGSIQSRLETPLKRESREILSAIQSQTPDAVLGTTVNRVVIQPNDTLWAISRARYGAGILYVRVYEANRELIRDPDLIYPGQVFVVPD